MNGAGRRLHARDRYRNRYSCFGARRTVRAECLDWTLVWNEGQLYRVLTEYLRHYNTVRPHRSLELQPPNPTSRLTLVQPGGRARPVQRVDVLGGLIHKYRRVG
ncbi:integrase core domain-containing protein [Micromonospora sp. NBC_00617]|uniref:integrase core domain-containing protein n=1 Tax=Micromonospora sp. NBC_00617 TaxID=2903587 RepID=UPI0030E0C588